MTVPPVLAGRYAPGRVLGRGGVGAVFAATDERLGRDVAVKVLQVADVAPEALERFRREAQLLAALSHPNLVTVFDLGIDEDNAWLVMELLPGPTLADVVAHDGPLPVGAVLAYGTQVAGALTAAHAAGVVHRDVRPANVMLDGDGRCKLLDLGVARLAGASGDRSATLHNANLAGSVPFLAPEVIKGEPATPAVDAYAFGAFLFALLTGHPPYRADVAATAPAQPPPVPIPRLRDQRPDVPAALDELVTALLANDAMARPSAATAAQLLSAIAPATEPISAIGPATETLAAPLNATRVLTVPAFEGALDRQRRRPAPTFHGRRALTVLAAVVGLAAIAGVAVAIHGRTSSARLQQTASGATPAAQPGHIGGGSSAPDSATTVSGLLFALRSAIATASATGDLAPQAADNLRNRVDGLARSITVGNPDEVAHRLADLQQHLADMGGSGRISAVAYDTIATALQRLTAAVPAAVADGGDGGGG